MIACDVDKALDDPEVLRVARAWFESERALSDVAVRITNLEEIGKRDEAATLEVQVSELREAMDVAARELNAVAGEQLAGQLRRMKEEAFMAKYGRGHGEYKKCPDCDGLLRGRHREFCKGRAKAAAPAPAPKSAPKPQAPPKALKRPARPVRAKDDGLEVLIELVEEMKAKLAERDAVEASIQDLRERIAKAAAAS